MKEVVKIITNDKSLLQLFREALPKITAINKGVIRRCHTEFILKVIHARAGTIFHIFIERFIGHYSNKIHVEFRKNLQVIEKKTEQGKNEDIESEKLWGMNLLKLFMLS